MGSKLLRNGSRLGPAKPLRRRIDPRNAEVHSRLTGRDLRRLSDIGVAVVAAGQGVQLDSHYVLDVGRIQEGPLEVRSI